MNLPRRILPAAILAACTLLGACHRDKTPSADAGAISRAQEQLSQPAWLRQHLPARTVGYLRIPTPWGLLGAVPNGRPLDAALASEQHLKAVAALREAIAKDKLLADAGAAPFMLALLSDLRAPMEIVAVDPLGMPSPGSMLLASTQLEQRDVAKLNARFAQLGNTLRLSTPLDAKGDGALASGELLHFDAANGRLFVLMARSAQNAGAVDRGTLNALLDEVKNPKAADVVAKVAEQEQQIDASGQGLFGWVSTHGIGGVAASSIPADNVGTLPGDFTAKTDSIAFGWGTAGGHGQLQLRLHAPQARLLGYLAPKQFAPDFNVAGKPSWAVSLALPGTEQIKTFEDNLTLDFGAERAAAYRKAMAEFKQSVGFDLAELSQWVGPELVGYEDDAGTYTAMRVRDRQALYTRLQELAKTKHWAYQVATMEGAQVHSLWIPNQIGEHLRESAGSQSSDTTPQQRALLELLGRLGTHLYWVEDGDYLIFGKLPQALADRAAAKLDTRMDTWLKAQAHPGAQSLLGFVSTSRNAQRKAYYSYLQLLQYLDDASGGAVDLQSLPAAHTLNLPRDGVIGMSLNASQDDLSLGLTYEQSPLEMLTSGSNSMMAVATAGVLAAVAVPAYQDYKLRSQVVQAIASAAPAKTAILEFHQRKGRWPKNDKEAGLDANGSGTLAIGEGTIELSLADTGSAKLAGGTVVLAPERAVEGWAWRCHAVGVEDKYLPTECRHGDGKAADAVDEHKGPGYQVEDAKPAK
ncbi:Tfp pilus assembly protein, major pilin PilA [Dyella sp. OK004]|uniref:pilin n=1 Tax=Dyella sp. OK004 TaxID=1855292 RepID=UPI0008E44C17|nr:pilin [Dyella sp. OK004]SFS18533.1 Tfp pilus assembly protein, major pilin PilA [Dyella sp. OK004]